MQSPNRYSQVCMINNKSFIHCCFTTLFVVTVFSQGCAARPDLVKLQQEVKQEKHDQAKDSGELREEIDHLMDFQSELVKKQQILSRQQKEVMLLYKSTDTSLREELSEVRALVAQLRVSLVNIRETGVGRVLGNTENNQRSIEELGQQLTAMEGKFRREDARLQKLSHDEKIIVSQHGASIKDLQKKVLMESENLTDFSSKLATSIDDLTRQSEFIETRITRQYEQQKLNMEKLADKVEANRSSLTGFTVTVTDLNEKLSAQVFEQVQKQVGRIEGFGAQVQRMQSWVETRTGELAEQDAENMAMTAHRLGELRTSLKSFEDALGNIGEQLSTQLLEERGVQDEQIVALVNQVQQLQGWVESRAKMLEDKQAVDSAAAVAQLEKLRTSLTGFEKAIVRLGEGVTTLTSNQKVLEKSIEKDLTQKDKKTSK